MIKLALIDTTMSAGAGSAYYSTCLEIPVIYGATVSQPQVSVIYNTGTAFLTGGQCVIPCHATINIKYVDSNTGVVVRQQELNEYFTLGVTATAIPSSITVSNLGYQTTYTRTKCCKSYALRLDGAIQLTTVAA